MCKNQCQKSCATPACSKGSSNADIARMRELLAESEGRNPGMTLAPHAQSLRQLLDELERLRDAAARTAVVAITPVATRKMKRPADEGPFTGQQIEDRILSICGCNGKYDCDCVAVRNQALIELWSEYNTTGPGARQA